MAAFFGCTTEVLMTAHSPFGQDHSYKEFTFSFPSYLLKLLWYFLLLYLCCMLYKYLHGYMNENIAHTCTGPPSHTFWTKTFAKWHMYSIANKTLIKTIKWSWKYWQGRNFLKKRRELAEGEADEEKGGQLHKEDHNVRELEEERWGKIVAWTSEMLKLERGSEKAKKDRAP